MVSETFHGLIERADFYAKREKFRSSHERRDDLEGTERPLLVHP
ncbi:MAG: hypothetical protein ACXV4B_01825 [Halobacteriota archaeon]